MLFMRKSKRGFTLIELMVVVAIIGILALLGLRAYTTQIEKSKNAVVKANAGTVQTLIQSELADTTFASAELAVGTAGPPPTGIGGTKAANMQNPYDKDANVVYWAAEVSEGGAVTPAADAPPGVVWVAKVSGKQIFYIQGTGAKGTTTGFDKLSAIR